MKRFVALQLILAVSIGVCLPGCDLAPTTISKKSPSSASKADDKTTGGDATSGQTRGQPSALDTFLTQNDGSAQVQSGRAIVKDAVAILQADVDMQVGSTLVDDPNFVGKVSSYRIAGLETSSEAQLLAARMEELKRAHAANEVKIKELLAKQAANTMTDAEHRLLGELMGKQEALGREYQALAAKIAALNGSSSGSTTPAASPKPTPAPDHHTTTGGGEQHTTTGTNTNTGTNSGTTAGSGGNSSIGKVYSNDEIRKMMAEIAGKAETLVKKFNSGTPLSEVERKELENYKRSHEELGRILAERMRAEAAKQQANNPSTTVKPPEKRPEPPKFDPHKKPEAPKQEFKPEEHLKRPDASKNTGTSAGGSNQVQPGFEDMKKKLEELQRANEGLKKQLEKQLETAKRLTEELRNKLAELAKKKDDEARKQKEQAKNVEKGVVDNGDGTHTYTMKMETANKSVKITHEVEKTVDDLTKQVIEENSMMTKTLPNGTTMKIGRTELHNEDGSTSSTFNSEITKAGKTKTVSWNKTVNEDGSGSATGTIKKPDGSTINIEITKDADGTTKTTASDSKHKVKAEITKGELDKNAHAKIVDSDSGKSLAEGAISDTDAVTPDAD
jgi:hypothetical protein